MGRSFSESEDKRAQAEIISSIRQNPIERSNKPMLIGCGSYPGHVFDLLRLARLNGQVTSAMSLPNFSDIRVKVGFDLHELPVVMGNCSRINQLSVQA
jgi:hypothetical protein